jgi:hypothetical protein
MDPAPRRKNRQMSDAGDFVDASLQREGSWIRAEEAQAKTGSGLRFYGSSVGAVRGTIRDVFRRHQDLSHDDITALSSELWAVPVFERRLAAIVLLQSSVPLLTNSDLTRIEGFVRGARLRALVDPLAVDVVGPLVAGLDPQARARADGVLDRWVLEPDVWLRRAALLSPLRALRSGAGDWPRFVRHAEAVLAGSAEPDAADSGTADSGTDGLAAREAISIVLSHMEKSRPELGFHPEGL